MFEFEDYDDDFDEAGSRRWRWVVAVALLALVAGGVVAWSSSRDTVAFPTTTDAPQTTSADTPTSTGTENSLAAQVTPVTTPTTVGATAAQTSTTPPTTAPRAAPPTTSATVSTDALVEAPTTVSPPTGDGEQATGGPTYPVAPDGTPIPIKVTFDSNTITIAGFAPDDRAVQRLSEFVTAFSLSPEATVVQDITIDPSVPASIGVGFLDLNSVRFGVDSTEISADQAPEFDRIVNVMNLLPDTSLVVVVLDHASSPADQATAFAQASERALNITAYMVNEGIDPSRVSSRAGETGDLVTNGNSDEALALNRRAEFIFYGLLT